MDTSRPDGDDVALLQARLTKVPELRAPTKPDRWFSFQRGSMLVVALEDHLQEGAGGAGSFPLLTIRCAAQGGCCYCDGHHVPDQVSSPNLILTRKSFTSDSSYTSDTGSSHSTGTSTATLSTDRLVARIHDEAHVRSLHHPQATGQEKCVPGASKVVLIAIAAAVVGHLILSLFKWYTVGLKPYA